MGLIKAGPVIDSTFQSRPIALSYLEIKAKKNRQGAIATWRFQRFSVRDSKYHRSHAWRETTYEGVFVVVFLAAFFLATFFFLAAFFGAAVFLAAFLATFFLATFFLVAAAFFLATDSSSKKTRNLVIAGVSRPKQQTRFLFSTTDTKRPSLKQSIRLRDLSLRDVIDCSSSGQP